MGRGLFGVEESDKVRRRECRETGKDTDRRPKLGRRVFGRWVTSILWVGRRTEFKVRMSRDKG